MSEFYLPLTDSTLGRVFECIQYDESCDLEKLKRFLIDHSIPAAISPLHDKDKYSYDDDDGKFKKGDLKKPHRHVLLMFSGIKSGKQVREICVATGLAVPAKMEDKIQRLRYLCHLDDLDKEFYDPNEVIMLCSMDYETECQKAVNHDRFISEMENYIREEHQLSYSRFSDYCRECRPDWYHALNSYATFKIKEYMRSIQYEKKLDVQARDYELDLMKQRQNELREILERSLQELETEIEDCKKNKP